MKLQDIIPLLFIVILFLSGKRSYIILFGIGLLIIAIPLYMRWIFFTAHKCVEYGALAIFISLCMDINRIANGNKQ